MDKKEPISFDFVFGGFKQQPKEDFEIKNNGVKKFERKYPSEPGKLCKNVFKEDYEQPSQDNMEDESFIIEDAVKEDDSELTP